MPFGLEAVQGEVQGDLGTPPSWEWAGPQTLARMMHLPFSLKSELPYSGGRQNVWILAEVLPGAPTSLPEVEGGGEGAAGNHVSLPPPQPPAPALGKQSGL